MSVWIQDSRYKTTAQWVDNDFEIKLKFHLYLYLFSNSNLEFTRMLFGVIFVLYFIKLSVGKGYYNTSTVSLTFKTGITLES